MKTQIKKIIISVAALLFLSSGVSFAQDRNKQNHKQQGKAYGHYKIEKHHPGWSNKQIKTWKHLRKMNQKNLRKHQLSGYYCEDGILHYYDKRDRRWKDDHKHRNDYHHRSDRRENTVYKWAFKDPGMVFKIIVK